MIRTYNKQTVVVENGVTKYLADIFCNSTDTKPTANLVNGSKLTEVDTGKTFLYDEANTEWVEFAEGGGSGGGGTVVVSFTNFESTQWGSSAMSAFADLDGVEFEDLHTALMVGKRVITNLDFRAVLPSSSVKVVTFDQYTNTTIIGTWYEVTGTNNVQIIIRSEPYETYNNHTVLIAVND